MKKLHPGFMAIVLTLCFGFVQGQSTWNYNAGVGGLNGEELKHPEMDQSAIARSLISTGRTRRFVTFVNNQTPGARSPFEMRLFSFDAGSNQVFDRHYSNFCGKQIVAADDGNYLLVGYSYDQLLSKTYGYTLEVVKVSQSDGSVIWRNRIEEFSGFTGDAYKPVVLINTNETAENYIVALQDVSGNVVAVKMKGNGTHVWSKVYVFGNNSDKTINTIANRVDNNGVIIGLQGSAMKFLTLDYNGRAIKWYECFNFGQHAVISPFVGQGYFVASSYGNKIRLVKLSESSGFSSVIAKSYSPSDPYYDSLVVNAVFEGANGTVDVCYSARRGNTHVLSFLSVDTASLQVLSSKYYIEGSTTSTISIGSMCRGGLNAASSGYMIRGLAENQLYDPTKDVQFIHADEFGNAYCAMNQDIDPAGLVPQSTIGSFIATESFMIQPFTPPYALHTMNNISWTAPVCDELKSSGLERRVLAERDDSELSIYPVPLGSASHLNIDFATTVKGCMRVDVVDVSGRTVTTKQVNVDRGNGTCSIDLSAQSEGMYLLRICMPDGTIHNKRCIR